MSVDALRYAYRLLSYRGRSHKELEQRLGLKGFSKEDIQQAIGHLKEHGYLDDLSLAESLKRVAMDMKLLGQEGARQFLRQRGIERQVIEGVLSDYNELGSALRLVGKKLKGMAPEEKTLRRISALLRRRGYCNETIRKAIKTNEEETFYP